MSDTVNDVAKRLIQTRLALGFPKQAEFCRELGIEKNLWNPFEKGSRQISLAVARKLKKRFGVTLDWIFDGDPSALPAHLASKLGRLAA